jgi:hypothetical protein
MLTEPPAPRYLRLPVNAAASEQAARAIRRASWRCRPTRSTLAADPFQPAAGARGRGGAARRRAAAHRADTRRVEQFLGELSPMAQTSPE